MFLVVFGGFWWFLAVHGLKQRHSEMIPFTKIHATDKISRWRQNS